VRDSKLTDNTSTSANSQIKQIDLVIPCLNESESAPRLVAELERVASSQKYHNAVQFNVIIIDDGSNDDTANVFGLLLERSNVFNQAIIVSLSRNFGKEAALTAGLAHCTGNACVILDADLQDPPYLIHEMIDQWRQGSIVVNAVRRKRDSDNLAKRLTANLFYVVFMRASHLDIQFNASDYRLLDQVAINAIQAFPERVRFSKGFFAWVGYKQTNIYFDRPSRSTGKTKWKTWRLWNYALDGIFSFSTAPLRIWSYIGCFVTILSFMQGSFVLFRTIVLGIDIPGYASLFSAVTFLGGLQLMGIGIIGEYIGRIYIESKHRPHYIIKNTVRYSQAVKG
jgi:glycosyltransferase involved in cell wall biosynthesis